MREKEVSPHKSESAFLRVLVVSVVAHRKLSWHGLKNRYHPIAMTMNYELKRRGLLLASES